MGVRSSGGAGRLVLGRRQALGAAAAGGVAALGWEPGTAKAQGAGAPARPQPPQGPVLLPDTTSHLGAVRAVAVSPDGSLVATGGVDCSIRLWDGATGRAVSRWRTPIGEGQVGAIDSLAFAPDGSLVFAAAVDWVNAPRGIIYVFEVVSGRIIGVLSRGPRNTARFPRIEVSRSGHLAVATEADGVTLLAVGPTLRISTEFLDRVRPDDRTTAVCFSPDGGTLAAASQQGRLRLFSVGAQARELPEPLRGKLPGQPLSLAFSADGRRVAVGFANRRGVAVVDLASRNLATLEPPGAGPGNLAAVAWGTGDDGAEWLFAGGTVQQVQVSGGNSLNAIFAWRDGRAGPPLSARVAEDSIADLARHPSGGVVFGSSDAAWGRVLTGRNGRRLDAVATPPERLDLREMPLRRSWGVSASGHVVEFQGLRGQPALRFDLASLTLDEYGARIPRPDLNRPRDVGSVQRPPGLRLRADERLLSLDVSLYGGPTVVGTEEALLLLSQSGEPIARQPIAAPAWAVAFSRDGRIIVAAHGDGTVRWYGLAPDARLRELGGLFVHADRRRWVAWRNDGRFAYSELGGATLVGLHQNGRENPERRPELTSRWITVDQAFRQLHDPDAVSRILEPGAHWLGGGQPPTLDAATGNRPLPTLRVKEVCTVGELPRAARLTRVPGTLDDVPEAAPPPAGSGCLGLEAAQPVAGGSHTVPVPQGSEAIRVRLGLSDAREPVWVDALVNGVNAGRSRHAPGTEIEKLVPLPSGDARVEFRVRAGDAAGAFNRAPLLVVTRSAPASLPVPTPAPAGAALRVLAVGVNRYGGTVNPLRLAVSDAETFASTVQRLAPSHYATVEQPVLLRDEEATLPKVRDALAALALAAQPDDAVMIYLSGHGVSVEGSFAFVTADVRDANAAVERGAGCLGSDALVALLSNVRAARTFLFLDTCHAAAFDLQGGAGRLGHDTGRFVLTAAARDEEALDGYDGVNGVFGYAVKEGLSTLVPASGGVLDALELGRYVRAQVPVLAARRNWRQRAVFKAEGDLLDFPVAQRR